MKFGLDRKSGFKVTAEKLTADTVREVADSLEAISDDVLRFIADCAAMVPNSTTNSPAGK
jgi:hypothetical protein